MSASNITVNGEALDVVLDREHRAEIQDLRKSEESVKLNRHIASKPRAKSGARTSPGEVVYVAGQKAQKVVVCANIFAYADKAPFPLSGHSALGALVTTADEQEVQCHDCGEWFRGVGLGQHVRQRHGTAREYRLRHGLRMSTGLISPVAARRMAEIMRANRSTDMDGQTKANSSHDALAKRVRTYAARRQVSCITNVQSRAEHQNFLGKCKAQRLELLRRVASEIGHTPSNLELKEYRTQDGAKPLMPSTLRRLFSCRMKQVYVMANLSVSDANRQSALRREEARRTQRKAA